MHTPDGLLTSWVCVLGFLFSGIAVSIAYVKFRNSLTKDTIIRLSSFAGLIFVLQMLNFPIIGGTSGHIIGAAFVAILMGPYAAIIVMASVLLVQTIVFGDGGTLALGINVLNMGVIASFVSHYTYVRMKNQNAAIFSASWLSVMAASVVVSLQLAASGAPFVEAFSAMTYYHAMIGIGEAVATLAIVKYFAGWSSQKTAIVASAGALLGMLLLPLASRFPDGLETVTYQIGFFGTETIGILTYNWVGGLIGAVLAATACWLFSRTFRATLPRLL